MNPLTLTRDDRRAIDWIGSSYTNGDDLRRLLWGDYVGPVEWDSSEDIVLDVSRDTAWAIYLNNNSEDNPWPCFNPSLSRKLNMMLLSHGINPYVKIDVY